MSGPERASRHRRNPDLEKLLEALNRELASAGRPVTPGQPSAPIVFIVGAPRSGSTLLMQWLARSGEFAVPTNLISRFYAAPHIGARVQLLLSEARYDFNGELAGLPQDIPLASELGKTTGPLSPNEFWYFWRRFLPNETPRELTASEESAIDGEGFASELAALVDVLGKPLAMKGLILQYNLAKLAAIVPRSLFIAIERDPLFTMQSVLRGREEYYGDRAAWWSVEPPGTEWLRTREPFEQVAGQVHFTQRALRAQFEVLGSERSLSIPYESFCNDPGAWYAKIRERLLGLGTAIAEDCPEPGSLPGTNRVQLPPEDWQRLEAAHERVQSHGAR